MTTFPGSPRVLKGGLVTIDVESGRIDRIIALQYNPESVTRTLQVQAAGTEAAGRVDPLRIRASPIETLKLEAAIDATDQLEFPDSNPTATRVGIHPELAALETILYPPSNRLRANRALADAGTLEIAPVEAPLTLFVWSSQRVVPVRITDFSVTEEAFDPALNPIRARVSLGLRVLSVDDLGFDHRGGGIFMTYLQGKEALAAQARSGALRDLGLGRLP